MDTIAELCSGPADRVAERLLGCELVRSIHGADIRVRIVETESYDESDAASHSHKGLTNRNSVMFGPPGHLYVYFTYGKHYCCNVTTGNPGDGAAVLIRAVEPLRGSDIMRRYRSQTGIDMTNGPAKLCQALAINMAMNDHDLNLAPLRLIARTPLAPADIITTTRIGIRKAADLPKRFYIRNNHFVSHPLRHT